MTNHDHAKLIDLVRAWDDAKERERQAVEERRQTEDAIVRLLDVPESLDGVRNVAVDDIVTLKITGRLDRKVDGDKAQALAKEHGLESHLSSLFRWRPEINAAVWKATDASITGPLSAAVTTKPGRPSFALITKKEET
jgi:hypothetical protein